MNIHPVDTANARDVNRFIEIPFKLYRDCPQWVPPLMSDVRLQLNKKKNPYYLRNDAAFFIAQKNGEDVGRIAALHPKFYNEFKGTSHAFFYLFESIDDQEVASGLLDAATEWARGRGLETLRGPLGFMAADGFGLLSKGFEYRPAVGIPYNFDYYPRLVETWGLQLEERVYSGYLDVDVVRETFPTRVLEIAEKVKDRYGLTIRSFKNKRELIAWAKPRLLDIWNRCFTHIAGDPPLTQEEVDVVAQGLALIAQSELIKFVVKKDNHDDVVGFLFCFNDISKGLQRSKGRLFPLGWAHILWDFRRTDWLNLNGMAIIPEYQGFGGPSILYAELFYSIRDQRRFKHADVVQISEKNAKSLNEMTKFGVDFYKTHHIYRRELNDPGERR